MSPEASANFIIQVKNAGLKADTRIIGGTTMGTYYFINAAGAAAEGTYSLAEYVPGGLNDLGKKFEELYRAKFNEAPDNFSAAGFTQALMIAEALKKAGANPTRQAIRDALETISDLEIVIGKGKLSMKDHMGQYEMNVLTVKDGQLIAAPSN